MQVENFECQIAQAQIGNFLAGSGLSQDAMTQLEEHIASCSGCKAALAAKREELKAMLTSDRAVVDMEAVQQEAQSIKPKSISTALRKKSLQQMSEPDPAPKSSATTGAELNYAAIAAALDTQKQTVEPKPEPKVKSKTTSYWKPLVYSLGLGGVLVGMSLFSNNFASIFGPKANAAAGLASTVQAPANTDSKTPPTSTGSDAPTESTVSPVTGNLTNPLPPPTGPTDGTTGTVLTSAPTTAPVTTPPAATTAPAVEEPKATEDIVESNSLGITLGALATTQFESTEAPVVTTPPVVQPKSNTVPKPVVKKAPVHKAVARRPIARKPVRRAGTRRVAVRSRGIKVYQP